MSNIVRISSSEGGESGSRRKVLIVDDDVELMELWAKRLARAAEITLAKGLEEARKEIVQSRFDLVLLDYRLGDNCGLDLIDDLRARGRCRAILMSSFVSDEVRAHAEAVGIGEFLEKTTDISVLEETIYSAAPTAGGETAVVIDASRILDRKGNADIRNDVHLAIETLCRILRRLG